LKLSLHATVVVAAVFAAICLGVAITGFTSLGELTDPAEVANARGFAWFWGFLAAVAVGFGFAAWWLARNHEEDEDG
jgi:hypothetical protein